MDLVRLLRVLATTLLGVSIGQAGFGSGLVAALVEKSASGRVEAAHSVVAYVVVGTAVACVFAAARYRRDGGPGWPLWFAVFLVLAAALQVTLGSFGVVGAHVFVGVLVLCAVTTYCSYLWRHQPASDATPGGR
ncbi:MAG: hypothetical protein ACRCXL_12020 [Dermatophilaceae bacterium]